MVEQNRRRSRESALLVISPIALLLAWELGSRLEILDVRYFSRPSLIAIEFQRYFSSGRLATDLSASLRRVGLGFVLGAVPGVILGVTLALSPILRAIIKPIIVVTYPIPKIAILPLLLLIFGIGETPKVALLAIGVFYLALYNALDGVLSLPAYYSEVSDVFHIPKRTYILHVAIPGALPPIFTGLRVSMGMALLLIVVAEFVGARSGIGYLVWSSWQVFEVERMFIGLMILSTLGYGSNIAMEALERALLPWR